MDCHQTNDVRRLVHLAFAFATTNLFKLFDIVNKVANQLARFLKLLCQTKQLLNVRDALCPVKVGCDNSHELG